MKKRSQIGVCVGVAAALVVIGRFTDDAGAQDARQLAYGKHLAQECTGCHRLDGVDNGIPSIIGWQTDAFVETLRFYQTGARNNPVMVSVASSLGEKQMEALAAYFASLPKPAPKPNK